MEKVRFPAVGAAGGTVDRPLCGWCNGGACHFSYVSRARAMGLRRNTLDRWSQSVAGNAAADRGDRRRNARPSPAPQCPQARDRVEKSARNGADDGGVSIVLLLRHAARNALRGAESESGEGTARLPRAARCPASLDEFHRARRDRKSVVLGKECRS